MSLPEASTRWQRWLSRAPAILFVGFASYLFLRNTVYVPPRTVDVGALAFQDLDGRPVTPSTLMGKAVVLNFWAPWCAPCRAELPLLQALHDQHPQAAIIGIEDDPARYDEAKLIIESSRLHYLMVRTSPAVHGALGQVTMLPTTLYLSRSGKVIHTVNGPIPARLMRRDLEDAIAAP